MSSRPDCNFCNTAVAMGSCDCGRNIFGELTEEEKKEQTKYFKKKKKNDSE